MTRNYLSIKVRNNLINEVFDIYSKIIINATEIVLIDKIIKINDKTAKSWIVVSRGTHIVIKKDLFLSGDDDNKCVDLLILQTRDGQIASITPFENKMCYLILADVA